MHVRSIGLATDLALARTRGTVTDREDYLVVRTPDDPSYYFGNLLVLPASPQIGEVAYWTRRFAGELGTDPRVRHVALRWDGVTGDVGAASELAAAGFELERSVIMTARQIASRPAPGGIDVRRLAPHEVVAAAELEYASGDRHDEDYRRFLQRRARWKLQLAAAGTARLYGAFDAGALVASLGLAELGGRARFLDVQTATTHRRRGIISALLDVAARASTANELVIVTQPGSVAESVYVRAGFVAIEHTAAALLVPRPAPQQDTRFE